MYLNQNSGFYDINSTSLERNVLPESNCNAYGGISSFQQCEPISIPIVNLGLPVYLIDSNDVCIIPESNLNCMKQWNNPVVVRYTIHHSLSILYHFSILLDIIGFTACGSRNVDSKFSIPTNKFQR